QIAAVVPFELGEFNVLKPHDHVQEILALMLERASIQMNAAILGCMVVSDIADKGEVHPHEPLLKKWREIGIVGEVPINLRKQRTGGIARSMSLVGLDQTGTARTGLKQQTRSPCSPCFRVDDDADP